MNQAQHYTQDDLLSYVSSDYSAAFAEIANKPLSEITIADLPILRQMPVLPDNIIIYDMKTGDKRSGKLDYTEEMKNNLIRFAKENAKDYLQKLKNK